MRLQINYEDRANRWPGAFISETVASLLPEACSIIDGPQHVIPAAHRAPDRTRRLVACAKGIFVW